MQTVAAVVLNYNGWRDTVTCVRALEAMQPPPRIVVVDNASTDESPAMIRLHCPQVELLQSPVNGGFAAGNNLAMSMLMHDVEFIWLINNDAVCESGALQALLTRMRNDPGLGAVGSVVLSGDGRKLLAWGGGRVHYLLGISRHVHRKGRLDFITGASMMLRSRALQSVGLFDEWFFLYWEDVDLCVRLRNAGWRLAVAQDSIIRHKEGASFEAFARRDRITSKSRVLFFRKHSHLPIVPVILGMLLRCGLRLLRLCPARAWAVFTATLNTLRTMPLDNPPASLAKPVARF